MHHPLRDLLARVTLFGVTVMLIGSSSTVSVAEQQVQEQRSVLPVTTFRSAPHALEADTVHISFGAASRCTLARPQGGALFQDDEYSSNGDTTFVRFWAIDRKGRRIADVLFEPHGRNEHMGATIIPVSR